MRPNASPLLHKDKEVLRTYVDDVLEGLAIGMRLVGAQRGLVGVKEKYKDVIDLLRSKVSGSIDVAPLRDAYPAGDEFILVYDVLGRVIPPGGIPPERRRGRDERRNGHERRPLPRTIRSPKNTCPLPGP